jgi:nucleotide-binding universal stress UspA family protein
MIPVRSILAATDCTTDGEPVLRSAARLAEAFGADLTVVTIADPWKEGEEDAIRARLVDHWHRSLDAGEPASDASPQKRALSVRMQDAVQIDVAYDARPFHGVLVHAAAVGADLIVLGTHSGSEMAARWSGTTAERIVRSSDVPCLVVTREVHLPVRHAGVATDFTPSARGGALLALDWLPTIGASETSERRPTVSLVHVAPSGASDADALLRAEIDRIHKTDGVDAGAADLEGVFQSGSDIAASVARWAEEQAADLLVVPTEARRGLRRMFSGSQATLLTLTAPCPVLLVPPALWRRSPIPLARVASAVEENAAEGRPEAWVERRIARARRPLELVHLNPDDDVVRQSREAKADLLIVHEDRTEPRAPMASPLQTLLERTPIPVLVLRDLPDGAIRRILVAVDTGDIWYEKFGWARLLADRFDAHVTIFHAIDLSLSSQVRREPGGEFVPAPTVWMRDNVEKTVVPAMRTWLWERARLAGLRADRVDVVVGLQSPTYAIPLLAHQISADLVIVAAHAEGRLGRIPLSPIARATLDGGTYPVLVVVDRAKREAEWREATRLQARQDASSSWA